MRRISDGITSESRFKIPPPSSASTQTHYRMHSSSSSTHVETIKQEYATTSTFSYSYSQIQQPPNKREEYYYPVYNKQQEWSEGILTKEKGEPTSIKTRFPYFA